MEKKKILLIDDEPMVREVVKVHLQRTLKESVIVLEAEDGPSAERITAKESFDCIISDLKMPKTDPVSMIKQIKSSEANRGTPIIILSGNSNEFDLSDLQPIILIEKPASMPDLVQLVRSQLELGKLEARVSSRFVYPFLGSVEEFLKEQLGEKTKQGEMNVQAPEIPLKGDVVCLISFTLDGQIGYFAIGFEKAFLDSNAGSADNKDYSLLEMAEQFAYGMYDGLTCQFLEISEKHPVLKKVQGFAGSSEWLTGWRGVNYPITTEHGTITVYSISAAKEPKTASYA